jgi:Tfp pilus assembly protein FimT
VKRSPRRGVTLFELLLVVGIIAFMAILTVPAMDLFMPDTKVKGSVDQVRAAWADARARAIEEGRPYRFSIVPDTGHYRIAPDSPEYWGGGGSPQGECLVLEESLPGGVRFQVADAGNSGADTSDVPWIDPDQKSAQASPAPSAYSHPVVFLPDGTAREDVAIAFVVKGARRTTLQLRGLTGSTSLHTD